MSPGPLFRDSQSEAMRVIIQRNALKHTSSSFSASAAFAVTHQTKINSILSPAVFPQLQS